MHNKEILKSIQIMLRRLIEEHNFSEDEACIPQEKESEPVFKISEKLKTLLEDQLALEPSGNSHTLHFKKDGTSHWTMTVDAGGLEIPFLLILLTNANVRLYQEKKSRVIRGREAIEKAFQEALKELPKTNVKYKVFYRKGSYHAVFKSKNSSYTLEEKDSSVLVKKISKEIPAILSLFVKINKKD